jgi:hypothetical protein
MHIIRLIKNPLQFLLIFMLILSIPQMSCKKQSTSPDVSNLTRPVIWLSQFNLSFTAAEQGPNPSSKILEIKNSGQQTLEYTLSSDADWLNVSPESGTSTGQVIEHKISVNKDGMAAQNQKYTAKIIVTSSQAYNNPQELTVSLMIEEELPPKIWIDTKELTFRAAEGGKDPASQVIAIKNSGEGTLDYKILSDVRWMSINPDSGKSKTGEKSHTVSVDISGMNKGTYTGIITVKDRNATNNPQEIDVTLNISEKPEPKPVPTNNEVGISISPSSGGTGTIVTITVFIKGNTSPIESAFGLKLNFDASVFQYQNTSKGSLTSSWLAVDGGASGGTVTVGGFRGAGNVISTGSQGSIAIVKFKVIHSGASLSRNITLTNLIDDLVGMKINPGTVTFVYP